MVKTKAEILAIGVAAQKPLDLALAYAQADAMVVTRMQAEKPSGKVVFYKSEITETDLIAMREAYVTGNCIAGYEDGGSVWILEIVWG